MLCHKANAALVERLYSKKPSISGYTDRIVVLSPVRQCRKPNLRAKHDPDGFARRQQTKKI
jgi:hypothetical protein